MRLWELWMASIINLIRGTDREYFDLFERAGANVARAGELLDEIVASVAHCGPLLRHGADRVDRFKPWRSLIGRMNWPDSSGRVWGQARLPVVTGSVEQSLRLTGWVGRA